MNMRDFANKEQEERIRELVRQEMTRYGVHKEASDREVQPPLAEKDPELLWKQGRGSWREDNTVSPWKPNQPPQVARQSSFIQSFIRKTMMSGVIFGLLLWIHQAQPSWSTPIRSFVTNSLQHEINFSAVQTWYESKFGGPPSFIPIFHSTSEPQQLVQSVHGFSMPIQGKLAQGFAVTLKGVEITPEANDSGLEEVKSVETGRVLEVSNDALTGTTVVIQHSGGYESIYGRLSEVNVAKGDWLESGDTLGNISDTEHQGSDSLYFAMKKNGTYVDPTEVVPLD